MASRRDKPKKKKDAKYRGRKRNDRSMTQDSKAVKTMKLDRAEVRNTDER